MAQKDKLMDLLYDGGWCDTMDEAEKLSNYLIDNGVYMLENEYFANNPPCWYCNHGWGSISTDGVKSCNDTCEEFKRYIDNLIIIEGKK